jgi:hypothetical protein
MVGLGPLLKGAFDEDTEAQQGLTNFLKFFLVAIA